jgi:hypothetical protein
MTIPLPRQFQLWAEAEVAAGRTESVETLAERALEMHRIQVEQFRNSLDHAIAEADRDGWIEGDDVLAEMDLLIADLEREAHGASIAIPARELI